MLLSEILRNSNLDYTATNEIDYTKIDVIDITRDTRQVIEGSLFIAVIGLKVDGHDLINDAIEKGAKVIVHSKDISEIKEGVAYIRVSDTRECMAIIAKTFFNIQDSDLIFLGVTGTNGKTTSTYMMKHILEHAGNKVGLIGTIANYIGDKMIPTSMTTPEAIELFRLIKDMREAGCKYCLMEVSSHASAMGRVEGLNFSRGMFTNLTQDHMDYHKTFENYYNAKFKFIKGAKSTVINCDDQYGKKMLDTLHENSKYDEVVTSYGVDNGFVRAKNLDLQANGSTFDLYIGEEFKGRVKLHIAGLYNIYNALGVIGMLVVGGYVAVEEVIEAFDTMKAVAGRCERVYHDKMECTVVVDYAHTPDALENILKTMKEVTKGKIITVFGCGGDRDKTKRPIMGSVAAKYSDITIVTSDNPRTEDPRAIIDDIIVGITDSHTVIEDRKDAIEYACKIASKDDIVVIAGKGHEDYQIIGTTKHHFSDKETVINYFNSI
ncbi:UDP-N-acetylmuramoyl-L-alanyl-D-glutamate--2,6-diaminopimelate ligase [Clostridium sp.]|uniref:UDP-N-acetylmuramoyl-L-alanyl-D-glutamate--2, 6-diaminopimelate ligase n=1 Tax=Clostridium sp. TaxID=1506 RepID=UPI00262461B7|nr:UDP-N-acetylmuramoyl-L-alanyl-D-glutamate--2,6-diaminopimelate ligase [Clostridium sp.]